MRGRNRKRKFDFSELKILKVPEVLHVLKRLKIPSLSSGKKILCYTLAIIFVILSLADVIYGLFPFAVRIIIDTAAAIIFFGACYYLIRDINYGIREKLKPAIYENPFTNRVFSDYKYRTMLLAVPGLGINMVFAIFNGIVGIVSRSPWFGSMAAYYIVLSIMRYSAIWYAKKAAGLEEVGERRSREITIYHRCGISFIMMTIALGGTVMLMVLKGQGKSYPGFLIFAVAAYTFYKIILSAWNVVKAGRMKQMLLTAIRDIGFADALVSILSLQTAMFASFGGDNEFIRPMNAATGTVVCLMILIMGIRMIRMAAKEKKTEVYRL